MFRFGHFSDIHFRYTNYDTDTLRNSLINKLHELRPLNAIFITGDIFYQGDTDPNAEIKVKEYIEQMAQASQCDMENVFICAGNHDLKRSKARANTLKNIIDDYKDTNGTLTTKDYSPLIYDMICEPFNQICERITGASCTGRIHRFIPLTDINLIMLNTAVFAGQTYPNQPNADGKLEDTNLFICDDKFRELENSIKDFTSDNKPVICIGHHSPECFEKKEKDRLTDFLERVHCDLYLCGHIHTISTKVIENTTETYQISCGGPFKDQGNYNQPSFVIGEFNPNKRSIDTNLYYYNTTWALNNQARAPWVDGHWKRILNRLKVVQEVNPNVKKHRSEKPIISESELIEKYFKYIISQSLEIDLNGLPTNTEDVKRRYKLNQLFVPLHFSLDHDDENRFEFNPSYDTKQGIYDFLSHNQPFRNLVLADPGAGKTTLIKWIASVCCSETVFSEEEQFIKNLGLFPIWIRCRDVKQLNPTIWDSIIDITRIAEWIPDNSYLQQFILLIKTHLDAGDALLLIDGLDEIDDESKRDAFIDQIQQFVNEHPRVNAVVTSRIKGFDIISGRAFSDYSKYGILPLSSEEISLLCQKWYSLVYGDNEENQKKALLLAERISTNDRLKKLAGNPLLLTTLLLVERRVGTLPNKRAGLYHEAINVLLESWNSGVREKIDLEEAKYQLAFVAFYMMSDPSRNRISRTQITKTELRNVLMKVRSEFSNYVYTQDSISGFLKKVEQKSAILYKRGMVRAEDGHGEQLYCFQHLTFEEYLAAYAVAKGCYPNANDNNRDGKILLNSLLNAEMREVIALTASIDERCADNIVRELILQLNKTRDEYTEVSSLRSLLLQLIADEVSISKSVINEAFNVIFKNCVYRADHSQITHILMGKYGNDLKEFFAKWDRALYGGIIRWGAMIRILTDDLLNPVEYYLQNRSSDDYLKQANSLTMLTMGKWINESKVFNSLTPATREIIKEDIKDGLRSKNELVLTAVFDALADFVPGLWDKLDFLPDYYNAAVFYINKANRIPDFVIFEYYNMDTLEAYVSSKAKLTKESIEKMYNYFKNSRPWNTNDHKKALSVILFASLSCVDAMVQNMNQIYMLILEESDKNNTVLNSSNRAFLNFVKKNLNNELIDLLPRKIGDSFMNFCNELENSLHKRYSIIQNELLHKVGNRSIDELMKGIDVKKAELERKQAQISQNNHNDSQA